MTDLNYPYYFNYFIVSLSFTSAPLSLQLAPRYKVPTRLRKLGLCFIHLCLYANNLTLSWSISHVSHYFFALFRIIMVTITGILFSVIHDIKIARRDGTSNVSFCSGVTHRRRLTVINTNHGFKWKKKKSVIIRRKLRSLLYNFQMEDNTLWSTQNDLFVASVWTRQNCDYSGFVVAEFNSKFSWVPQRSRRATKAKFPVWSTSVPALGD